MKFGVKLPNSGPFAMPEFIRRTAVECERLGFDSLWTHDHVHRTKDDAKYHFVAGSVKAWDDWEGPLLPNVFESVSTLFYAAGATTNMELGTSVVVLPLRNPVWFAKEIACLDQFSGGRVTLGIGSGGKKYIGEEMAAIGAPELEKPRGKVVDEWIDVMRRVWTDEIVEYQGEYIQVSGGSIYPKPIQERVPIVYGGQGPRVERRIVSKLDGWLPIMLSPATVAERLERLHEQAEAIGRDPAELRVIWEGWLCIDNDNEKAAAKAAVTRTDLRKYSLVPGSKEAAFWEEQPEHSLVGDPETITEMILDYERVGVQQIILRMLADDFSEAMESLAMFKETVRDKLPEATAGVSAGE